MLYWFFCYSVMVITLVVSCGRALSRRSPPESAHCLLLSSFVLIMMGATLGNLLGDSEKSTMNILSFVATSGVCMGIYATPAFALSHGVITGRGRFFLRALMVLAAGCWMVSAFFWQTPLVFAVCSVVYALYATVIGGISTFGIVMSHRKKFKDVDPFWKRITKAISLMTLVFLPVLVFFDFFGVIIPTVNSFFNIGFKLFPRFSPMLHVVYDLGFRFFPLFFVIWDGIYLYNVVRGGKDDGRRLAGIRTAAVSEASQGNSSRLSTERMDQYSLSPRERQVACLLVDGRSYKEIADSLCISIATAKTHINRLYAKASAGSKIELLDRLSSATMPDSR